MIPALWMVLLAQSFPDGPGKEVFEATCNFCHPASFVSDKALTRAEWQDLVAEMLREEAVPDASRNAIVTYLTQNFPRRVNVNQAPAEEIARILEIPPPAAAAIVAFRQANGALKSMGDLQRIPGVDGARIEVVRNRVEF